MKLKDLNSKLFCKITNKEKIEKMAGIYRIFITINEKEYSYVGESINWYTRLSTHKRTLKKTFENKLYKDKTDAFIKAQSVPLKEANYFKMFLWAKYHNKNYDDFNFEIIESYETNLHTEKDKNKKEQKYIEKYKSYRQGFNGINNWVVKLSMWAHYEKINSLSLKELKEKNELLFNYYTKTEKIKNEIKKEMQQKDYSIEKIVPWLEFNILKKEDWKKWPLFLKKIKGKF